MENFCQRKEFLMLFDTSKRGVLCDIKMTQCHHIIFHISEKFWRFIRPYKKAGKWEGMILFRRVPQAKENINEFQKVSSSVLLDSKGAQWVLLSWRGRAWTANHRKLLTTYKKLALARSSILRWFWEAQIRENQSHYGRSSRSHVGEKNRQNEENVS